MRPPPGDQQMLLFAFAFILLPWAQLVDAQQQHRPAQVPHLQPRGSQQQADDGVAHQWAATPANVADGSRQTIQEARRAAALNRQPPKPQQRRKIVPNKKNRNAEYHPMNDASALATLAPAQAVRAPNPSRYQRPTSIPASGLSSPQHARSLEDWEVEDFVLLATVDGDLYASDRRTGKERWHLEVDQAMVETKHHRFNHSILDEDYNPIDHYIWAVEPSRDGAIYVWIPDSNAGLVWTGFTMKEIVEQLAPHKHDDPAVVYTGDKKTTMITLDAATGRVLKWFGSSGSHVNEEESCLRPNALYDMENEECSSTGTITLGRTEYTVGIQRADGVSIATLKFSEWSPNNFDNDLWQQHHSSLDSRYITSQHDGKVYAFDYARSEKAEPLFSEDFSTPVARVFDVCRPWDATLESNPDLVVLPQPPMPSQDETIARMRSNSIFLNQTRSGSWYAMSGRSYPLIINAPIAQISRPDWWDIAPAWDTINQDKLSKALVGTHFLETFRGGRKAPTLPSSVSEPYEEYYQWEDVENESNVPVPVDMPDEPTILTKVKLLPQTAANSVIEFISNPILVILLVTSLIYNEQKLRRSYRRLRQKGILNQIKHYMASKPNPELVEDDDEDLDDYKEAGDEVERAERKVDGDRELVEDVLQPMAKEGAQPGPETEKVEQGVEERVAEKVEAVVEQRVEPTKAVKVKEHTTETSDKVEGPQASEKQEGPLKTPETSDNAELDKGKTPKDSKTAKVVPSVSRQGSDASTTSITEAEAKSVAAVEGTVAQEPTPPTPKPKRAHRGRRGGVKHRKRNAEASQSRGDERVQTVQEAVDGANQLGNRPTNLEPDVVTVPNDMAAVTGSIIRMGNIEVNTDEPLGTGSNGTLVFAGKFDGREVAVKRMLIQFYDIASQETRLLRESDDHPNGTPTILFFRAYTNRDSHPILLATNSGRIPLHRLGTLRCLVGRCRREATYVQRARPSWKTGPAKRFVSNHQWHQSSPRSSNRPPRPEATQYSHQHGQEWQAPSVGVGLWSLQEARRWAVILWSNHGAGSGHDWLARP